MNSDVLKKLMSEKIDDVVNAYKHALLAVFPRARYVVGLDARFLWLPLQMLPEWMSDFILVKTNKDRLMSKAARQNKM